MIKFTDAINILVKEHHPNSGWGYVGDINNVQNLDGLTIGNNETVNFTFDDVVAKKKELENAEPIRLLRLERNHKLAETDVYMVSDFPITTEQKTEWQTYRQKLRDLDFSDPDNITWPEKPE